MNSMPCFFSLLDLHNISIYGGQPCIAKTKRGGMHHYTTDWSRSMSFQMHLPGWNVIYLFYLQLVYTTSLFTFQYRVHKNNRQKMIH